ncbi:lipopolysaccharide biosynthesis protein [Methylosinus sporium]|uniref:lipopolysaccharide biosynthesis protein n=1 Tax=Methylosinus sporium TaxID=428 RepID=UPI00383B9D68
MADIASQLTKSLNVLRVGSPSARWFASRGGIVLRNILAATLGRVFNVISTILSIPLAIGTLGQEQYAAFAIIISITIFFSNADFGLATALVNEIAQADARGDNQSARRAVSQVWLFLIACAIVVVIFGRLSFSCGVVDRFFPELPSEVIRDAWAILIGSSALGIPLALAQRVFFALQMGAAAQAWATAGRIAALVGAVAAACFSPSIASFVVGVVLLPNVVAGLSTIYLFYWKRKDLRPSLSMVSTDKLGERLLTGLSFTALQLLNFAEAGVDTILIAQYYNAQTVAQYDLLTRLFGYVTAIVGMGMWPLWPAISSAATQRDFAWIGAVRNFGSKIVCIISIGLAGTLFVSSDSIIRHWTGVNLTIVDKNALTISLVFSVTALNAMSFQQIFLNAFNDITRQTIAAVIIICIIIPLKLALLKAGILYGIIIVSALSFFIRYIYFDFVTRNHLAKIGLG